MSRRIYLGFMAENLANDSKISSKDSKGANTSSFTQGTAARQPTFKSEGNTDSSVAGVSTASCDGSNYLSLATSETLAVVTPCTIIVAWTSADYTNDTWLLSSSTGDGHYGIKSGGRGAIFKGAASKSSENSIATNTTAGATTAYTFGSDVEMIAFVNDGANKIDIYNIDGDLIGTSTAAGNSSAFPIDHVLGKSDGTLGLNAEILDISIFGNTEMSQDLIIGFGNKYKQFRDL